MEVVSACYLNALSAIKPAGFGHGRSERCAISRRQHNMGWYNVVDTGIFARLSLCECVLVVSSIKFPNSPLVIDLVFLLIPKQAEIPKQAKRLSCKVSYAVRYRKL